MFKKMKNNYLNYINSKHETGGILNAAFGDSIVYSTAKARQRLQNLFNYDNDFEEIKNPVEPQKQENSQNQGTLTWDDLISSLSTQKPESTSTTTSSTSTRSSGSGPRGYRNYNPLNIRISSNPWSGKVSNNTDGSFEQFTDMAHGFRAGIKNMQTWINRGKNTLRDLISTWAPDSDRNNSASYAKHVSDATGIGLDEQIDPNNKEQMTKIAYAMAKVENGIDANMDDIIAGWNLV